MSFSRSEVIQESCSKDEGDSEIESEKLFESSTEKEKFDEEDEDHTPVVVRRRPKKTPTTSLPPGKVSSINDVTPIWDNFSPPPIVTVVRTKA